MIVLESCWPPASASQLSAMAAAYEQAQWAPDSIDYIECHATGTPLGDRVELESLQALLSDSRRSHMIGSVKGNAGHTLTGAGAIGLLRLLLAMEHGQITPHCQGIEPFSALTAADGLLQYPATTQPWPAVASRPRRASLSGFGFGGINAHVLIEEYRDAAPQRANSLPAARTYRQVALVGLSRCDAGGDDPDLNRIEFKRSLPSGAVLTASAVDRLQLPTGSFRIPPKEIEQLLPQQWLTLAAFHRARQGLAPVEGRTHVYVGAELDPAACVYISRWRAVAENLVLAQPSLSYVAFNR